MSNNTPMPLNSNVYTLTPSNTSSTATLLQNDATLPNVIITNSTTQDVFVASGRAAFSAVFPTSATAPLAGQIVAAGAITTFAKNPGDRFISAIQATSGTGNLYIAVNQGE